MPTTKNIPSILVAEDDSLYGKIYLKKLEKEGYKVTIAQNGEEAEKQMNENKYDLVLLDLIMPIKDGFEVLDDMKAGKIKNKSKVIVMSNLSQMDDIKRVKDAGAVDYFTKANISIGEMVEKVKKYLQ